MIEIVDDLVGIIKTIPGTKGRVYRRWPKKKLTMPAILVSRVGGNPILTDASGSEVIATLTYSVDVNAASQEDLDTISEAIVDKLAEYNFHRSGLTDLYDEQLQVYRVVLTFSGTVDIRGNTFTGGY